MKNIRLAVALGLFASLILLRPQPVPAQDGIKRVDVQTSELSIPGHEAVQQMVDLQAGSVVTKHTHPGEEITVVLDGTLLLEVAGKPPMTVRAGQGFTVRGGVVHSAKATGTGPTRLLATYVVEKGKPLRSPAP